MNNLFEMAGIDPFIEKKEEPSKKETNKKGNTSSSKKKGVTYKLPITVCTGYRVPFEITGEKDVSYAVLKKRIAEELDIPEGLLALELSKDNKSVYVAVFSGKKVCKGTVKLSNKSVLILPNGETGPEVSALLESESGDVAIESIQKLLADEMDPVFALGIGLIPDGDKVYVTFEGKKADKIEFPITITVYGQETIVLSEEEYKTYLQSLGNDVTEVKYDQKVIEKYILTKYSELEGHFVLQGAGNCINVVLEVKTSSAYVPKKVLFPTNAQLFVMSTHPIQLTAEMFGGADEVEEDAIITYAENNISPIFKKGRCRAEFFKDDNYIFLTMKGSTKGAVVITEKNKFKEKIKESYGLFHYIDKDNKCYYVEKNPGMLSIYDIVSKTGSCKLVNGRIPYFLLELIQALFAKVARVYNTEILVRIYWNEETSKYEMDIPKQKVTPSSVDECNENRFAVGHNLIPVAEFHSHCTYSAFFSNTDDKDENMAMVYGVFGNMDTDEPSFIMRSFAQEQEYSLSIEDVFAPSLLNPNKDLYKEEMEVSLGFAMEACKEKLIMA